MKKVVINESQLIQHISELIKKKNINEYGYRGYWKPEWDEFDQMLAMFNSKYGIDELGFPKEYIAKNIIGSSVSSFNQMTSNFDYLDGKGGLDRPHELQELVYNEYKDYDRQRFKQLCLNIIHKREQNPPESVKKMKLGSEIGNKRDDIKKQREDALKEKGFDPTKHKLTIVKSEPKNKPIYGDEKDIEDVPQKKKSPKDEVREFLKSMYDKVAAIKTSDDPNDIDDLSDNIQFIMDYIDDQLDNKNAIHEMHDIVKNRKIPIKVHLLKSIVIREQKKK